MASHRSAERDRPSSLLRMDSDSLIILDGDEAPTEDARNSSSSDDDEIAAQSELQRQQTDPLVRHRSQQILDLTTDQAAASSNTDKSPVVADTRSYDRRHRAKVERQNRAGGSGAKRKTRNDSPRRRAAVGATKVSNSPLNSQSRTKQGSPDQARAKGSSPGSSGDSSVGIPPMLEDNADGVNAKIALYSHTDTSTEDEENEGNPVAPGDAKQKASEDDDNLFDAPPNADTVNWTESHKIGSNEVSSPEAFRMGRRSTRMSDLTETVAPGVSGAQLTIANAVATEDLEEQIRQTLIGNAVHATQVTPMRESASAEAGSATNSHTARTKRDVDDMDDEQSMDKKRRLFMLITATCVTIIAVIVIAVSLLSTGGSGGSSGSKRVVGTEEPPKDSAVVRSEFLEWLKAETTTINPGALNDTASPQYRAFDWMMEFRIDSATEVLGEDADNTTAAARLKQQYALASIYYSTNGDTTWLDTTNWLITEDMCRWDGPTCNGDELVESLRLRENNLTGTIPPELGLLDTLVTLNLAKNSLGGNAAATQEKRSSGLPTTIGLLTQLTELRVGSAGLSGTIPSELGNCGRLVSILARNAKLTGSIPSELGKMTSLTALNVPDNALKGQLPAELGNLTVICEWCMNADHGSGALLLAFWIGWCSVSCFEWKNYSTLLCSTSVMHLFANFVLLIACHARTATSSLSTHHTNGLTIYNTRIITVKSCAEGAFIPPR